MGYNTAIKVACCCDQSQKPGRAAMLTQKALSKCHILFKVNYHIMTHGGSRHDLSHVPQLRL